jgi:hypothetical protein
MHWHFRHDLAEVRDTLIRGAATDKYEVLGTARLPILRTLPWKPIDPM